MRIYSASLLTLLVAGTLLCAAGCSGKSEPDSPGKVVSRPRQLPKPAAASGISPYMVSAVAANQGAGSAVQLKFELGGRPEVGQPLDVNVVVVPVAAGVDRISGTFQGDDGLDIVGGSNLLATDKPAPGAPISHAIKVIPRVDGIFALGATISTEANGQTASQKFTIPVIAGNGLSEAPAGPQAAGTDAPKPSPPTAAQ